jgi:hypothetical protein
MRHWLILVFGIVVWLAGGGTATARQDLPPTPNPSIFQCAGCPQIDDKLRAIRDELATLRERLDNIRSNQQTLGSSIARTAGEMAQHASDLATGKPGAADALGKARTRLEDVAGQLNRLNDAFRRTVREESLKELEASKLRQQQDDCRRECPDAHTGRTNSMGSTTATQTATPPAECHDCEKLAADLRAKQDRLNQLQEQMTADLLRTATRALEVRGTVAELQSGNHDAAGRRKLIDSLDTARGEIRYLDTVTSTTQQEILKQAAEVEAARQALEKCDETCAPPTTPISRTFSRPLLYAAGGGIAVAAALLAGGNGDSPTVIASTPVTPQQPVTVTPTPQPQPQVRRPASLVNVSACVCVDNSAVLDGTLQLCQRLRQIRATGTGNSIALTGDAPLPAFQGTFNENTGVFELSATTVVGPTTSNVVIAGTVEMNGNFSNLRVSFGASGRQTLYTLMTAVAQ